MLDRGVRPTIVTFTALAKPFVRLGNWERVEEIAQDLENEGLTVNEYFLNNLLYAYGNASPPQRERAIRTFRSAVTGSNPLTVDEFVFPALSFAIGRRDALNLMKELGLKVA